MNDQEKQPEGFRKEFSNPEIPMLPSLGELPDMESFEGARVAIEGWEIVEMNSNFNPETGERVETPILASRLKVFTTPLGYGKKADGSQFPIRATSLFGLRKDKNGNLGISSHPNAKIQKFFKKLKVNSLPEIKGKYVTVTVSDENWLRIVM